MTMAKEVIDLGENEHFYKIESSHPRALWVSPFSHVLKFFLPISPEHSLLSLFLAIFWFL